MTAEYIDNMLQMDNPPIFNNSFKKTDYYRIPPIEGIANVNTNGNINFLCNNKSMLLALFDSLLKVRIKISNVSDKLTIEHNAILRMFSSAKLMFGRNELESMTSSLGEASTMVNLISNPESFKRTYGQLSCHIPDVAAKADKDNKSFVLRANLFNKDEPTLFIPLRLIFGFCDYRKVLHQIDNILLTLNRKTDAEIIKDIFWGELSKDPADATKTVNPKISFTEFEWWIPNMTPNLSAETFFNKRLNSNKNIEMTFMKRHSASTKFSSSKYQWTVAGISKQIRYMFFGFKTEDPDITKNNSLFTLKNILTIQVRVNGSLYPIQKMTMDVSKGDVSEPYLSYIEACNWFGNEAQLSLIEYRDYYPIICINTSSQSELLKSGNECSVEVEKSNSDPVTIFCLLLEDNRISFNLGNGVVSLL